MLREALKKSYQTEKEKLKKMNRSEKVSYIWMYYKVPIFVILIVIAGTTGILWNILHNQETVYSLAIVNETMNMERDTELSEQLEQYFGLDQKKEKIVVDSNYNISYQFDDDDYSFIARDIADNKVFNEFLDFYIRFNDTQQFVTSGLSELLLINKAPIILKNIAVPTIIWGIMLVCGVPSNVIRIAVVTLAIPTATMPTSLAIRYKSGESEMAATQFYTTILAIITLSAFMLLLS